jgi:hypothetical protein
MNAEIMAIIVLGTGTQQGGKMASHSNKVVYRGGGSDSVYGLGMIGAWVYYIGRATTPRDRILGFLKGLVWPALLVYEVLKFFNAELPASNLPAPARPAPTLQQAQVGKPSATPRRRSANKPAGGGRPKTKKSARK